MRSLFLTSQHEIAYVCRLILTFLNERALYCDTDSVFYIQIDNELALILYADSLGSMVNELNPDHYITDFVSAGAKNS
jgi:hypothetical protein